MAEIRREDKRLKKNQSVSREAREELQEEIRPSPTKPLMETRIATMREAIGTGRTCTGTKVRAGVTKSREKPGLNLER